MKLDDGREVLLSLSLPLPLNTAGELFGAIGKAANRLGYTNINLVTDGPLSGHIVATPPGAGERPES